MKQAAAEEKYENRGKFNKEVSRKRLYFVAKLFFYGTKKKKEKKAFKVNKEAMENPQDFFITVYY